MGEQRQAEGLDAKSRPNKGGPLREGGQQRQRGEHYKKSREKQQTRAQLQGVSFD
jgi:hypothetical protein